MVNINENHKSNNKTMATFGNIYNNTEIGNLEVGVGENAVTLSEIAQKVSVLEEEVSQLQPELNNRVSRLKANVTIMDSGLAQRENEVGSIETEVQALETSMSSLESRLSGLDGRITVIQGNTTRMADGLQTLESVAGDLETRVVALEERDGDQSPELASRLSTVESSVVVFGTELSRVQADVSSINEEMSSMSSRIESLENNSGSGGGSGQDFSDLTRRITQLETHAGSKGNPHTVTKAQIGLGKVENKTITVTSSSVSDGVNTFNQFNPTQIQTELLNAQTNIQQLQTGKQEKLVSGISIKTINGHSLLGSGNISISSGGSGTQEETSEQTSLNQEILDSVSELVNAEATVRGNEINRIDDKIDELEYTLNERTSGLGTIARYNIQVLTMDAYEQLSEIDNNTLYFIIDQ